MYIAEDDDDDDERMKTLVDETDEKNRNCFTNHCRWVSMRGLAKQGGSTMGKHYGS